MHSFALIMHSHAFEIHSYNIKNHVYTFNLYSCTFLNLSKVHTFHLWPKDKKSRFVCFENFRVFKINHGYHCVKIMIEQQLKTRKVTEVQVKRDGFIKKWFYGFWNCFTVHEKLKSSKMFLDKTCFTENKINIPWSSDYEDDAQNVWEKLTK